MLVVLCKLPNSLNSMRAIWHRGPPAFHYSGCRVFPDAHKVGPTGLFPMQERGWKLHLSVGSPGEYNNQVHCHQGIAVMTPATRESLRRRHYYFYCTGLTKYLQLHVPSGDVCHGDTIDN